MIEILLVSLFRVASAGDPWVVIVAGSNGYQNYRHQADACHAYHVALSRGVPADHVILMMFDDVANNEGNPFMGKLFNTANGTDVYAGCKLAYREMDVSMENFFKVLHGDATAGGAVLGSGANDDVFVVYTDHGAPGYVTFPSGPAMHASDLSAALATMHSKNMYGRLLLYMDACNSGSMFETNPPPPNALVVTAANDHEDSWAAFCPPYDKVLSENGRETFSCLGDVFTISWMLDAALGTSDESVGVQIDRTIAATTALHTPPSHPMQFGNSSLRAEAVALFEGDATPPPRVRAGAAEPMAGVVSARDVRHVFFLLFYTRECSYFFSRISSSSGAAAPRDVAPRSRRRARGLRGGRARRCRGARRGAPRARRRRRALGARCRPRRRAERFRRARSFRRRSGGALLQALARLRRSALRRHDVRRLRDAVQRRAGDALRPRRAGRYRTRRCRRLRVIARSAASHVVRGRLSL